MSVTEFFHSEITLFYEFPTMFFFYKTTKKLLLNSFKKCEEYINETSVELFLNRNDKNKGFNNRFNFDNNCHYQINLYGFKHPNFPMVKHLKS